MMDYDDAVEVKNMAPDDYFYICEMVKRCLGRDGPVKMTRRLKGEHQDGT